MSYIVPTGKDFISILTAPTGITTSLIAVNDIITDDKVGINNVLPSYTQGNGSCVIKRVMILEYDSNGSPALNKDDIDIVIFNNKDTDILNLNSGDAFTLVAGSNLDKVAGVVSVVSADYKELGVNYAFAAKECEVNIQAADQTQISFSYALVAREECTFTATHTLKVRFDIERN